MRNINKDMDMDKALDELLHKLFDTPLHDDITINSKEYHITITNNRKESYRYDD